VTQLPLRKLAVLVHADIVDSTVLLQANEALSRMPWLFVISRNSSSVHKGQQVDLRKAAGALGAQYVLEGSLRKSGARVRVTAQLIDAMTEKPIRAGKFDRELADVFFALQ
jgi:adenylate cyclase